MFRPSAEQLLASADYGNLLYVCTSCNAVKGHQEVADPTRTLLSTTVVVQDDGTLVATTSIDLNEQEIAELKSLTNQAEAAVAVRCATTEYLRFARRKRLKELSGQVQMDDNWRGLEEAELNEQHAIRES